MQPDTNKTYNLTMADGGYSDKQSEFAQLVMELSLRKYRELPKKGKPKKGEEWTPLATILSCEGILCVSCSHVGIFSTIVSGGGGGGGAN